MRRPLLALAGCRRRGPRENESAARPSRPVDLMADAIPDSGDALPFVNHMRAIPHQHHRRVSSGQIQALVDIGNRGSVHEGRPRFAAPLRPRYLDSPKRLQVPLDLHVGNARQIPFRLFELRSHGAFPSFVAIEESVAPLKHADYIDSDFLVTIIRNFCISQFGFSYI